MQCNKCGSVLAEGATFCPNCGAPVEQNLGNAAPNNLNDGTDVNTTNNQGVNPSPDLMAQMPSQNDMQPASSNVVNDSKPNITNQTAANIQSDLMSNANQNSVEQETPNTMSNMGQNMNNQNFNYGNSQQTAPFPNVQPAQPMNSMSQGQMAQPSTKKPINKKTLIIGGIVIVAVIVVLVCFFVFSNKGTVVNMEGVNVWVPNDYTEESQYGYDKVYMSKNQDVIVGLITKSAYGITLDQYMDVLDSGQGLGSIKCEKGTKQTIKGQEWGHYICSTSTQKSNMYIATKDDKVYMIEISAKTDSADKIASIDKKIEQNLELTK